MTRLPPLRILTAFEAVARHRSFTRAASELCITKSAVSHRIKLLEEYFQSSVFVRRSGGLEITPQGAFFLESVRNALETLQTACARMPTNEKKVVRVAVRPAFASNWLVEKLGEFHRLHEDIDLEIHASKMTNLNSVGADVAICYGKENEWFGFEARKLMSGELFPVCSPSYRDTLGKLLSPNDLLRTTLLRLPRHDWELWFQTAGVNREKPITGQLFSDAHLMLHAAATGQGVALSLSVLANKDISEGRLVRLFDISVPADCSYYAVYRPDDPSKLEVTTFMEWLVERSSNETLRVH